MSRTLNRRSRSRQDEEYEEEEPRRSRRARDDADAYDEEEPARPSRRRARDDADANDEEPPRRGRRSRDDADEADEEEPRARRSRSESRGEEGSASAGAKRRGSGARGWKSFREKREVHASSDYVKNFKYPEEETLTKILDEEPFTIYTEHWIDELKKKSYGCLSDLGEKCPLCAIGDKPRVYAFFNLLDLSDPDNPTVWPWKVSASTMDQLEKYAASNKTSPLNRDDLYWSVYKSGGGRAGRVQVHVQPVKERDLVDDWDTDPLHPEDLDDLKRFTEEEVTEYSTKRDLQQIADELD